MPRLSPFLRCTLAALVLSASGVAAQGVGQGAGQGQETATGRAAAQGAPKGAKAEAAIGCTSLANLRSLLRSTGTDRAAALALIRDPKSDLGCSPVDRAAVTGLADHVALNGRAYDCLTLKGTAICHWTVAGAVAPPERAPERPAAKPARGR